MLRLLPLFALLFLALSCGSEEEIAERPVVSSEDRPQVPPKAEAPSPMAPAPALPVASDGLREEWRASARKQGDYAAILQRIYARTRGAVLLGSDRGASSCATILAALDELPSHAIDTEPYGLSTLGSACSNEDNLAERDVLLTRAFLRYVLDFRYLRRTNPYRKPDSLSRRLDSVADRLVNHVARAREDLSGELASLPPKHPLYDKLRAFLPKYRALAAAGEIERFHSERRLKKGMRGPEVSALRERVRAEGFEPGPPGERFDKVLHDAVVDFQSHRGIAPIGEVGPQTIKALNVTMKRRLQQIELSLQRWRESKLRDGGGRRLRVNLPRYSIGLWGGEHLLARHKAIIGSDRLVSDMGDKVIGYLNRTHLLDSAVYQIILNPYWRVPKRIAIQEIGPAAEKDPEYLATKGIKLVDGPEGPLYLQSPGEHNPLGRVKFLFKNDWALYLHDTDKRWLFSETRRAFSHGCIRVDKPLDLAREIARLDSGMEEKKFKRLVRMGTEYGLNLKSPLAIHLQYVTAEVDDEGRLLLLPDVYRYDRDARKGKLPANIKRPMKAREIEREIKRREEKKKR